LPVVPSIAGTTAAGVTAVPEAGAAWEIVNVLTLLPETVSAILIWWLSPANVKPPRIVLLSTTLKLLVVAKSTSIAWSSPEGITSQTTWPSLPEAMIKSPALAYPSCSNGLTKPGREISSPAL
jgi:hypothetical protein